jgi:hypothetical protein
VEGGEEKDLVLVAAWNIDLIADVPEEDVV